MDDVLSRRRFSVLVLVAGALVSGLYLLLFWTRNPFSHHLVLDSMRYDQLARSLVENGFRPSEPHHQAPLYPMFVAGIYRVFGPRPGAVYIVQSIIGAAIPWLLYSVARRVIAERGARIAAVLALFHGALIALAPRLLPTVPSIALQLVLLWIVTGPWGGVRRAVGAGALVGFNALFRPNLLLLLPWVVWLWLRRTLDRPSALALLGTAVLVIAPAAVHNARTGGGFVPIAANGGETFYHGNNPRAAGSYALMAGLESADILNQSEIAKSIAEREQGRSLNAAGVQRHWFEKGLTFWRENPGRAVWLVGQKAKLLIGADEAPVIVSPRFEARAYHPVTRLGFVSMWLIVPFAALGLAAGARPGRWWVGLVAAHAATLIAFYVSLRYRLPLEILLLIPAGAGVSSAIDAVRGIGGRPDGARVGARAWVLFAVVATISVGAVLTHSSRRAEAESIIVTNLGTSQAKGSDHAAAARSFARAAEINPQSARPLHYLGRALAVEGRMIEAVSAFRRAAELAPGDADVLTDLAAALLTVGDRTAAHACLERASTLTVPRATWHVRTARLWLGVGEPERAIAHYREAVRVEPKNPIGWRAWAVTLATAGACDDAGRVIETAGTNFPAGTFDEARAAIAACR